MRTSRRRVQGSVVAGAVLVLLALGGCSGDIESAPDAAGGSAASTVDEGAVSEQEPAPAVGATSREVAGQEADTSGRIPGIAGRPAVQSRAVIRRGEVSIVTKEMNRARVEIDDLLGRFGGYIASEDTSNDRAGQPDRSVLVMRVPEPAFDEMMGELTKIGRTTEADRRSEDVTTQVIDVETRVATQEASLEQLRRFLDRATDVEDMIRVESEIAARQAELESLKAQQKYLRDNTAMSTVTVRLRTPDAPPPPPAEDESGFLAGLEDGWHALSTFLVGAATVVGALLPFALTIALVGVPTWLLVRSATRRRQHTTPPVAPDAS